MCMPELFFRVRMFQLLLSGCQSHDQGHIYGGERTGLNPLQKKKKLNKQSKIKSKKKNLDSPSLPVNTLPTRYP